MKMPLPPPKKATNLNINNIQFITYSHFSTRICYEYYCNSLVNHLLHHDPHFLKMNNIDAATNTEPLK
jgi:hypothetical protein